MSKKWINITRYLVKKSIEQFNIHSHEEKKNWKFHSLFDNKLEHNTLYRYKVSMFNWTHISFKGSIEGVKHKSDQNCAGERAGVGWPKWMSGQMDKREAVYFIRVTLYKPFSVDCVRLKRQHIVYTTQTQRKLFTRAPFLSLSFFLSFFQTHTLGPSLTPVPIFESTSAWYLT